MLLFLPIAEANAIKNVYNVFNMRKFLFSHMLLSPFELKVCLRGLLTNNHCFCQNE